MARISLRHSLSTGATLLSPLLVSACSVSTPGAGTGGMDGVGGTFLPGGSGGETAQPYRRRITISAQSARVPEDYSVAVRFDHRALVAQGKSLESGEDVRIVRRAGDRLEDLDRVLDPGSSWNSESTLLWFRTRAAVDASQSDTDHYLYYGDRALVGAPADPTRVYMFWDGFDSMSLASGWKYTDIGASRGFARSAGGVLRIAAQSGDIGGTSDSFAYLHVTLTDDFSAESMVTAAGGLLDSNAKVGGVMVRQSDAVSARQRTLCRLKEASRISAYRTVEGGPTERVDTAVGDFAPERQRIDWIAGRTRAFALVDGDRWEPSGPDVDLGAPPQGRVLAGIPLATKQSGADGWVEADWFRVRRLVDPEPVVRLGPEEPAERLEGP